MSGQVVRGGCGPGDLRVGGAERAQAAAEALDEAVAGHVEIVERVIAGGVESAALAAPNTEPPSTRLAMNSVASEPMLNTTWPGWCRCNSSAVSAAWAT